MQPRLPLNHLNTLAAAAELLSFQQAAERLHVSPSAVSHQIRHLEKLLSYKLFDRLDKRVRLTRRGEQLFAEIQEPLRRLREASQRALQPQNSNALALSAAPAFATRWLLPRMRDFQAGHPEITLSVFATTEITDFRKDPFDAAIRLGPGKWEGTRSHRLMPQRLVAVCRPQLLKQASGSLTLEQIMELPRIHYAALPQQWSHWLASAGVTGKIPAGGLEVQNSSQALEAVQTSNAIALVDLGTIDRELASGRIVLASPHILEDDDSYHLVWPPRSEGSPGLLALQQWLDQEIAAANSEQ